MTGLQSVLAVFYQGGLCLLRTSQVAKQFEPFVYFQIGAFFFFFQKQNMKFRLILTAE